MYTVIASMYIIYNTQSPESTLRKKSNSVCFHTIRESVAMGEILTADVPTVQNPADLCTEVIPGGIKRNALTNMMLYDIND